MLQAGLSGTLPGLSILYVLGPKSGGSSGVVTDLE